MAELKTGRERRKEGIDDPEIWRWMKDGRIELIPTNRAKRERLLAWVAKRFDAGRDYAELEVNAVLAPLHNDVASLRRYLVDDGLMRRDHGIYRRTS